MKKTTTLIFLGLLFVLTGCNPSLHPLYTEPDLIYDPALVGEWVGNDGKVTWTFAKNGEKAYTLLYVDEKGKKGEFAVHLLKVGDRRFLDLYPADPDLQQNDFYKAYLLRVHTFMSVQQQADTLQMSFMNFDWLKKHLQEHPDAVKHEKVDDGVLLTAQPKELQAFLVQHDKTPDAWSEGSPLIRRLESLKK